MSEPRSRSGGARSLLAVSVSLCVLAASASTLAAEGEIDSFVRAVTTQSKQDALAFIKTYPSSHLAPDLIDLLAPDVALEVCVDHLGAGHLPLAVLLACDRQMRKELLPQRPPPLRQLPPVQLIPI